MPVLPLLMLVVPPDDLVTTYRAATRAEIRCGSTDDPDEITVCGRRDADRYRVPFVAPQARDVVPAERARLLEPKLSGCGRVGGFYVDCGSVGVTMTAGAGGIGWKTRKLAP